MSEQEMAGTNASSTPLASTAADLPFTEAAADAFQAASRHEHGTGARMGTHYAYKLYRGPT